MDRLHDVCGVGHALVDIQYTLSAEYLAELGVEKGIMTLIDTERRQVLFQALEGKEPIARASGGSAANTMIAVARFGGRAHYACQLGGDEWGDFYEKDLEKAGVTSNPSNRLPGKTGQCLVLITPDADRTLNTFLGASSNMGPQQVQEEIIANSQFVYLEGYLLSSEQGFDACCLAQKLARRHGTAISLTLSDPSMATAFKDRFLRLLESGVDLLFCNEEEALALTGEEGSEAACQALGERAASACITRGSEGALVHAGGRRSHIPALRVEAVDTTGAGDSFAGGVLFGITHGFDLETAAKLGSYAAAQVVSRYGPRLERPLAGQIDLILDHFSR